MSELAEKHGVKLAAGGAISPQTIETFAQVYVANGARLPAARLAAIEAGLSDRPNTGAAWKFLRRKDVQARIAELLAERYGELQIDAKRVMEEMGAIAFFDPAELHDEAGQLLPIHLMPPRVRAAIASADFETRFEGRGEDAVPVHVVKLRFHSKNDMLKLMAQHFKLINDNAGVNALASELTKQPREGRERARALRKAGVTDVEEAVIIPQRALPEPVPAQPEREDYA